MAFWILKIFFWTIVFLWIRQHYCQSGFTVFPVNSCPRNLSEVKTAALRLNCSDIEKFRNVYHCLPLSNLSLLVEFCYDGISGLIEEGNCMVLENQHLNNRPCKHFGNGCPDAPYFPKYTFNFPVCSQLNKRNNCYIADPRCPSLYSFVQAINMSMINRKGQHTFLTKELTPVQITVAVLSPLVLTALVIITVLLRLQRQRKRRNGGRYLPTTPREADPLMSEREESRNKKTENAARLERLILGPCTDLLREILNKEVSTSDLSKKVTNYRNSLNEQGKQNSKNPIESKIDFPESVKQYHGDISDLNIPHLYSLLRNISKIPPHSKGWGEIPNPEDTSLAANIERIRLIRNEHIGKSAGMALSDSEFSQKWGNILDIIVELEKYIGTSTVYHDAANAMKNCSMDQIAERKNKDLTGDTRDLETTVDNLSNELQSIRRDHDPSIARMIEASRIMITKHSKDLNHLFLKTHAFNKAKEMLNSNKYIVIKGNPGTGKTTIAKMLMKEFMDAGKLPLQLKKFSDLYGNILPNAGIVVLIDNMFQECSISSNAVQEPVETTELDKDLIDTDTDNESNHFIFTLRNDIYQEYVSKGKDELFFKSSMVDLSSKPYALQNDEILELAHRYNLSKHIDGKELIRKVSRMPISIGFPQCCKLAQNAATKEDVSDLLLNPVEFLKNYLNRCIKSAKSAVLVYILLSGGQVEFELINYLHRDQEMKHAALEFIGLHRMCINDFQASINSFDGFLTVQDLIKNSVTFSHSSVQESLFNVLFYSDPQKMIKYCHHSLLQTITTSKMPSSTQVFIEEKLFDDVVQRIANIIPGQSAEGYSSVSSLKLWDDANFHKSVLNTKECTKYFETCHDMNGDSMIVHFSKAGNKDWVEYLLNKVDKGQRYLSLNAACSRNHPEIVNMILSFDVQCDLKACFYAVQSGNLPLLLRVCESVDLADLHKITFSLHPLWNFVKNSLLQEICFMRQTKFIEEILQKYPFLVEIKDAQGSNALHSVASSGDQHAFNLLLNFGFDPYEKDRDNGHTVLTCACQSGRLNMVKYLIENYPDLKRSHTDHRGKTLFYWAAFCGKINMFEYIVDLYEKENVASSSERSTIPDVCEKNKFGESILDAACSNGHYGMCEYLINKYPQLLNERDWGNVLHSAAKGGNVHIFQHLTNKGLDIKSMTNSGKTVLNSCCEKGREDMFKYLNNKYPDLKNRSDNEGLTVLHSACRGGSLEIVSLLLKQGLGVDTLSNNGRSILHEACMHGNIEVCEYLTVAYHHLLNVNDEFNLTALHYAAFGGNVQIVRLLIKKDMNIYAKNIKGETILHICCRSCATEMFEYLVNNYSGLLEIRDNNGWTALHSASFYGALDILNFLIKKDIDITLKGSQGENVLHIACRGGNLHLCEFLMVKYPELLYEKDFHDQTIIQYAAIGEKWELFQYLIDLGIDFSNGMNQSASTLNSVNSEFISGEVEKRDTFEKMFHKCPSPGTGKSDKSDSEEDE